MSYSEFPHYISEDKHDLKEFIELYNDLLSKYAGTLEKIQEVSDRLDRYEENTDSKFDAFKQETLVDVHNGVAQDIAPLSIRISDNTTAISNLSGVVAGNYVKVEEKLEDERHLTNTQISAVETKIDNVDKKISSLRIDMSRGFDGEIVARNQAIEAESQKLWNRTYGLIEQVNTRIDNLDIASNTATIEWFWNNAINSNGMTAFEWYYYTPYTCEEWNCSGITCLEWYTNGAKKTEYDKYISLFISPVSGNFVSTKRAIMELASYIKPCGITAEQYDKYMVRAGDYDSRAITAYKYDFCGKGVIKNEFGKD